MRVASICLYGFTGEGFGFSLCYGARRANHTVDATFRDEADAYREGVLTLRALGFRAGQVVVYTSDGTRAADLLLEAPTPEFFELAWTRI